MYEPIAPAHFAFEIPYSKFHETARWLEESGLLVVKWKDGHIIDEEDGRFNLYFKDGDGNLLEIIAHSYVKEDVLVPQSPLNILYVREIGLPVKSVPVFTEWLKSNLNMKTMEDGDIFNFVIGGTAYIVATWWQRPWIPIAMKALPPKVHVSFGTPNPAFYGASKITLRKIIFPLNVNIMKYHLLSRDIHFLLCIHQSFIPIFLVK